MASEQGSGQGQVQIRFSTKQEQYAVPDIPFAVPSGITPAELNTLLNQLLSENRTDISTPVDFDFIVCKEFLIQPLNELLEERNISSEEVVDVEYVEQHPTPEPMDCLMHDDWVSAVQVRNGWILTGCYDNTLHLWTKSGTHHLTIPGHSGPVKAVAWVSLTPTVGSFVSVSHDQTAMLWKWNIEENSVDCIHVCRGHERSLECVSVNHNSTLMATGGWDTLLKIWTTSMRETVAVPAQSTGDSDESDAKRAKLELKSHIKTPIMTLKGHKEAISSVVWTDTQELATASWDHTLRLWDGELGGIKTEIAGNKPFFDMSYSALNGTVVTASADRHIRLYDLRSTEGSLVKSMFTSHTKWVQSVKWSTTDEHLFLSGAHDSQVLLWDSRSPKAPLYNLEGHDDKVMCCDWSNPKYMVSGGADKTVRIFKSRNAPNKNEEGMDD
ncbi:ribosome biogenesis protein WDR12 homolog [Thrips palmi]|uniref:Ribosome biogenesis protein WDR12 homolog n=1 Tax=Thrips palmi TaxID=161013 RepID=A0A6P8ZNI8_THRPL|nr:ribosome biogenesis protein WDR12 homolog [Thrips palmi]